MRITFKLVIIFKAIKKSHVAGKVSRLFPKPVTPVETSEFGLYIIKGIY